MNMTDPNDPSNAPATTPYVPEQIHSTDDVNLPDVMSLGDIMSVAKDLTIRAQNAWLRGDNASAMKLLRKHQDLRANYSHAFDELESTYTLAGMYDRLGDFDPMTPVGHDRYRVRGGGLGQMARNANRSAIQSLAQFSGEQGSNLGLWNAVHQQRMRQQQMRENGIDVSFANKVDNGEIEGPVGYDTAAKVRQHLDLGGYSMIEDILQKSVYNEMDMDVIKLTQEYGGSSAARLAARISATDKMYADPETKAKLAELRKSVIASGNSLLFDRLERVDPSKMDTEIAINVPSIRNPTTMVTKSLKLTELRDYVDPNSSKYDPGTVSSIRTQIDSMIDEEPDPVKQEKLANFFNTVLRKPGAKSEHTVFGGMPSAEIERQVGFVKDDQSDVFKSVGLRAWDTASSMFLVPGIKAGTAGINALRALGLPLPRPDVAGEEFYPTVQTLVTRREEVKGALEGASLAPENRTGLLSELASIDEALASFAPTVKKLAETSPGISRDPAKMRILNKLDADGRYIGTATPSKVAPDLTTTRTAVKDTSTGKELPSAPAGWEVMGKTPKGEYVLYSTDGKSQAVMDSSGKPSGIKPRAKQ